MEPIPRVWARVLPVSPDGEVLLVQDRDPAEPDVLRWGTIGGAVDPGESLEEAAVREMHSDGTFYATPFARDVEGGFDHLVPEEVDNVVAWDWWTPDALAAEGGLVADDLPEILAAAVAAVLGAGR